MFSWFSNFSTNYSSDASFAPAYSYTKNSVINVVDAVILAVSIFVVRLLNISLSIISTAIKSKQNRIIFDN